MPHASLSLITQRVSANLFDPSHNLADAEIADLVRLATRAPTAYNLQNWRFIAVRSPAMKARLRALADDQPKIEDAAVTFIICGILPDPSVLPERLSGSVEAGYMPSDMPAAWQRAAEVKYADRQTARDEAVRSATFGAATLIHVAQALNLASGAMVGFDAAGVSHAFELSASEIPVLLLAVGRPAPGNWPQKSRRPLAEVLDIL